MVLFAVVASREFTLSLCCLVYLFSSLSAPSKYLLKATVEKKIQPKRECFICSGCEEPLQDITSKGKANFEKMLIDIGKESLLSRLNVLMPRYHNTCQKSLFTTLKSKNRKRKSDESSTPDSR